jgi:hypothetical protein
MGGGERAHLFCEWAVLLAAGFEQVQVFERTGFRAGGRVGF